MKRLEWAAGLAAAILLLCIGVTASAQSGTGSISGVITGGALPGSSDAPTVITSGTVEVYHFENSFYRGTLVASTSVNPDGSYLVAGLSPGIYRVLAITPAHVREYYQERFALGDAPGVTVSAGMNMPEIDIEVDPAVSVSGTLYAEDGITPAANVPVSFFAPNGYDHKAITCSDEQGHYTISSAPSNAIFTVGAAPTLMADCGMNHYFLQKYYGETAPYDVISEKGLFGIPFAYTGETTNFDGIDLTLQMGGRISGHYYRPDGVTPVAGAYITLTASDGSFRSYIATDESGYYSLVLPARDSSNSGYHVRFENGIDYVGGFYGGIDMASAALVPVSVGLTTSGIDFVTTSKPQSILADIANVDPVQTISGMVTDAETVLPISSAIVTAFQLDPDGQTISAVTHGHAINGAYTVALPPGQYRISVWSTSATNAYIYYGNTFDADASPSINLLPGISVSTIDIVEPRAGEIAGTVYAGDGTTPLGNQPVFWGRKRDIGSTFQYQEVILTTSGGRYWFTYANITDEGLAVCAGGDYSCHPESGKMIPEFWQEAPSMDLAAPVIPTYRQLVRMGVDFTLVAPGTPVTMNSGVMLQGRPDAPDPLWSVPLHVVITPAGGGLAVYDQTILTDESGAFTVSGIAPGAYRVWVKGETTLATIQTATLAAGPTPVEFGVLRAGDADGSNSVTLSDFSILAMTFGKQEGMDGYDGRADFNGDGAITIGDFSLLALNFGQAGASP